MTKPLLAILSQRPSLLSELPDLLNDTFDLLVCDSLDEAEDLLRRRHPHCLLADFEDIEPEGIQEDQLLGELLQSIPGLGIVMLTDDLCPPSLERRSEAYENLVHLRGQLPVREIASVVKDVYAPPASSRQANHSNGRNASSVGSTQNNSASEVVLKGITRQFETNSPQMKKMLAELEVAARHNVTILLIGETGSGKTFLSRLIHEVSPRSQEPFLHVACGALPSELIESELFGHVKGAFTSAHADKEGKFLAAKQGTVLLDEIDVLGPEQQVKLLRVIETGEFEPVGSNVTHTSRARLVAASNLDLQPLVEQGRFRPDLYYRLNMLKFEIAPLRERPEDIEHLARKFVDQHARKHGVQIRRIDRSLFEALQLYPWPGNVRELENVLQRAVIYCQNQVLSSEHLPGNIVTRSIGPTNDPSIVLGKTKGRPVEKTLDKQIAFTEKEIIEQALLENNFSRTKTAKSLGISRVTLYNKMKKYGM